MSISWSIIRPEDSSEGSTAVSMSTRLSRLDRLDADPVDRAPSFVFLLSYSACMTRISMEPELRIGWRNVW